MLIHFEKLGSNRLSLLSLIQFLKVERNDVTIFVWKPMTARAMSSIRLLKYDVSRSTLDDD